MTEVCIACDGKRYTLSAVGHATGSPEVCAAISTLLTALCGYVKNLEAAKLARITTCSMESGEVWLDVWGGEQLDVAFDMTAIGLLQLQESSPEHIQVRILGA